DPRQLAEIEAGGAFAGLLERHGQARLDDNRRQQNRWERAALAELREGDTDCALDSYTAHDRVHVDTGGDIRSALVVDWHQARRHGEDVLMVAAHLRAVDDLNGRARALLRQEGQLAPA